MIVRGGDGAFPVRGNSDRSHAPGVARERVEQRPAGGSQKRRQGTYPRPAPPPLSLTPQCLNRRRFIHVQAGEQLTGQLRPIRGHHVCGQPNSTLNEREIFIVREGFIVGD